MNCGPKKLHAHVVTFFNTLLMGYETTCISHAFKQAVTLCSHVRLLSLSLLTHTQYYDGTIFHRIIKDFMVQGGDPTGSGRGGESIYGAPFQDEIHQRIRFNHRGQVAMANSGPGTNASQFFLTLAPCAWLDKKHTIFGKVTGNTIFNVLKAGDTEVDSNDFPRGDPPKLLSIEVLANPFGDMVARSRKGKGRAAGSGAGDEEEVEELRFDMGGKRKKGKKKKKKKDLNLLSFGIEAGEEEAAVAAKGTDSQLFLHLRGGILSHQQSHPRPPSGALGMRSSHDVSVDPKLAKEVRATQHPCNPTTSCTCSAVP